MADTPGIQVHFEHMAECGGKTCGSRCLCHESERAATLIRAHEEAAGVVAAPVGPPALLVDPEAVRLADELGRFSAPVVRAGVTADEFSAGAELLGQMVREYVPASERLAAAREAGERMADEMASGAEISTDRHRYLHVSVVVSTFGTPAQAKATAERVRRMLSVELHQPVVWSIEPCDLAPGIAQQAARSQGCSCYEADNPQQGPVPDVDCKVHGHRAR